MLKTSQTIPEPRGQTQENFEILWVFLTSRDGVWGVSPHFQVKEVG